MEYLLLVAFAFFIACGMVTIGFSNARAHGWMSITELSILSFSASLIF